jgi:hypothetical protein
MFVYNPNILNDDCSSLSGWTVENYGTASASIVDGHWQIEVAIDSSSTIAKSIFDNSDEYQLYPFTTSSIKTVISFNKGLTFYFYFSCPSGLIIVQYLDQAYTDLLVGGEILPSGSVPGFYLPPSPWAEEISFEFICPYAIVDTEDHSFQIDISLGRSFEESTRFGKIDIYCDSILLGSQDNLHIPFNDPEHIPIDSSILLFYIRNYGEGTGTAIVKSIELGKPESGAEMPLLYVDGWIMDPEIKGEINIPILIMEEEIIVGKVIDDSNIILPKLLFDNFIYDDKMLEMPMLDFDSETIVGKMVSSSPSLPIIDTSFDLRVYDLQTSISMPLLSIDGNVTYYNRYGDVTITLPAITGMVYGGASVAIVLPSIVSISSGKVSRFGIVTIVLPAIDSVSTALVSESCDIALILPAVTAKITGSTNFLATVAVVLPVLDIVSDGFTGEVATVAIVLPKIKSISTAWWNSKTNVSITLPAIRAGINTVILTTDYEVLVLNTKNMALTNYISYAYNSLYEFNGKHFGAKSSGIYELSGTTDNGSSISWKIKTGKLDMRENEKHSPKKMYAVLSYRPSGDLTFTVIGEDEEYEYDVESYEQVDGLSRVKLGRGIRDKYLQFELKNKNGEYIFLDKMKIFSNKATIK